MKVHSGLLSATLLLAPLLPMLGPNAKIEAQAGAPKTKITWKKTVIDKVFRSEGVGVADFNKDGKLDIFVGDVWYEAPDWKMHEVRPYQKWDGAKGYSESFACFPGDFNGDGYPDMSIRHPFSVQGLVIGMKTPGGNWRGLWPAHLLRHQACLQRNAHLCRFIRHWQSPCDGLATAG